METLMFRSKFHKYSKIFRALCARVILAGHGWLAIWVTGYVNKDYMYIMYAVSIPLFLLETGLIIHFRLGCEFKRFCTSFFCYLLTIVPALWIQRQHNNNLGIEPVLAAMFGGNSSEIPDILKKEGVPSLLEQSMMFIIILCRWLLPRGRIDRNSISQLLIMYSAISADILDFSELFDGDDLEEDAEFRYIILGVWSWSLVQFTLVVTTSFTLRRKQRQLGELADQNLDSEDKSEALSIVMVFFMQDGPFLVARCYSLFIKGIMNYNTIFFSLKNVLTLILGIYRLFVLCGCVSKDGNDLMTVEEVARSKESLDLIGMNISKTRNKKNRELARSKESLDVISEGVTNKKKNTKQGNKR